MPQSLRAKLQILALVLVLVPGGLVAWIAIDSARDALRAAVGRQLSEVAHDAVEELTSELADQRTTLAAWSRQDLMRDLVIGDLDKRITRFLRSLIESGAPYRTLECINSQGRIVASTDPARVGLDTSSTPWARAALDGETAVRGPQLASPERFATIDITAPIHDLDGSGHIMGALHGDYDWEHAIGLAARVRRTLLPHGLAVDVVVLNAGGEVVGSSWREDLSTDARLRLTTLAVSIGQTLPPAPALGSISRPDARSLVGYERSNDGPRITAVVMESLDEAYRPVRAMRQQLLVALLTVLGGALLFATAMANRMSRPLRALTRATREIAHSGQPRLPVAVNSRDEIGELAAAFNVMTAELARAQDDLLTAAKFAFVGEVAAGVAHEIRTPLGILRGSAQMLERTIGSGEAHAGELAGMMVEEVDRLDRVVDGLLSLARPHTPVLEPTALADVLARACAFVERQAQDQQVQLVQDFTIDPGPAWCDPEQMYQVTLNLVVNALQALSSGGTITVRTLQGRAGRVAFEVSDTGPGIPPELRERIFTPFFSLRPGGTGLGLALVQQVVQAHQGQVSADGRPEGGTTFRIELPAAGSTP